MACSADEGLPTSKAIAEVKPYLRHKNKVEATRTQEMAHVAAWICTHPPSNLDDLRKGTKRRRTYADKCTLTGLLTSIPRPISSCTTFAPVPRASPCYFANMRLPLPVAYSFSKTARRYISPLRSSVQTTSTTSRVEVHSIRRKRFSI